VEVLELAQLELTYVSLEALDFGSDGRLYGTMEGRLRGDRLAGDLRLTNLAPRRSDNVNLPTLRGVLTTTDGASVWVELDGIATLRPSDGARVFVTAAASVSRAFASGGPRCAERSLRRAGRGRW
jgi:hypothetical protein